MQPFLQALSLIFAAEAGDKSQLLVFAMATQYPLPALVLGIVAAIIVTQLFASGLGFFIGEALPVKFVNLIAGVLFLIFGLKTLLFNNDSAKDEEGKTSGSCPVNPFWRVFSIYTLGEIGDKTQFTTLVLASQSHNFFATFIGAVFGMFLANISCLVLGRLTCSRLSQKAITIISSVLYIGFGLFCLFDVLHA